MGDRGAAYAAGGAWRQLGVANGGAGWRTLLSGLRREAVAGATVVGARATVAISLAEAAAGYHCPMNSLMIDDSWFCSRKQHWPRVAAGAGGAGVNAKVPAPPAWLAAALVRVGASTAPLKDWGANDSFEAEWRQHRLDGEREDERVLAALRWQWRPKACRLAFFPPASALGRLYSGGTAAPPPPAAAAAAAAAAPFRGRSVFLVGDSLTEQQFSSLRCARPGRQRETHLSGIERANAAIEAASTRLKRPEVLGVPEPNSRDFVLSGAAGAGVGAAAAGFLRYHRNDHLFQDLVDLDGSATGRSETLRAAWRELLTVNVPLAASDRDVVLVNTGAHWTSRDKADPAHETMTGYFYDHTEAQMRALALETAAALKQAGFKGTLLFRALVPGHTDCEAVAASGGWPQPLATPRPSAGLPYNWGKMGRMNDVVTRALEAAARDGSGPRFVLLNTSMVPLRADGHHQFSSYAPGPTRDCLHYCLPGPADVYNHLLFHFLTLTSAGASATAST